MAADRLKTVATVLASPAVVGQVIQQNNLKTTPDMFMKQTDVQELTSRLVRISYRDTDPQKAVQVVNSTVRTFVDFYRDLRSQDSQLTDRSHKPIEVKIATTRAFVAPAWMKQADETPSTPPAGPAMPAAAGSVRSADLGAVPSGCDARRNGRADAAGPAGTGSAPARSRRSRCCPSSPLSLPGCPP